jgi:hypothetical protein
MKLLEGKQMPKKMPKKTQMQMQTAYLIVIKQTV